MGKTGFSILISILFSSLIFMGQKESKSSYIHEIDSLYILFKKQISTDPVEAGNYAKHLLNLSKKNNYTKGIASGYLGLGMVAIATNSYDTALFYYQK